MIIIDMNQIMISNLMMQIKNKEMDENLVRHMVLTSLRSYEKQFESEYGEVVLAYDSKHYWRKSYFSFYKQNRKKDREKSSHNWKSIFELLNKIRDEIKLYFPYKVIEVDGAEADDVISVLCKNKSKEKIIILSGDKDFIQLQKYPGVYQYNPATKSYIVTDNPYMFIKEHIIRGDKSDGIPNILSKDDVFVSGERQKPISQKKITKWLEIEPSKFCETEEQYKNYCRNKVLIDFDCIPQELENKIMQEYASINICEKKVPLDYFSKHKLNDLMQDYFFRISKSPFEK